MVTLSTGDLLLMREEYAAALPDRATIQRATVIADGAGGQDESWATLAANVPCRLSPVGGGEGTARGGQRISDSSTSMITFAWSQDITPADRIVIAGQAFDVQLVRRRGEWALSRRVEVREL